MTADTPSATKMIVAPHSEPRIFTSARDAVDAVTEIYRDARKFLTEKFNAVAAGDGGDCRYRAYYPYIQITTTTHAKVDTRLSFGHVSEPGTYYLTLTDPMLFRNYLMQQISILLENHNVPVTVGVSDTPIPLHFALDRDQILIELDEAKLQTPLRDIFDVPDLNTINDRVVNTGTTVSGGRYKPLAMFNAQRVDYSLARLAHYTATDPVHFQNFVLFTNYQFYIDDFIAFAEKAITDPASGYETLVSPGNHIATAQNPRANRPVTPPQMPAYHLTRKDGSGITLVNIGVGPSNAKTATDHIAVLRPHAWVMLGHCAGLRNSQNLGDYVLAHAYVREDQVLDADLPISVPIPPLAEIQIALEQAVAEKTDLSGYALKRVMRTGTVASVDNRNWELQENTGPIHRLSQSRAIALDMESATIAANGFRFRVPYGTLLCVSDKPLHGELKLPGMATGFYKKQVAQHLSIGIRAMELLREMPLERLHSRKLRSFNETAFL